jgi:hypothetical protein
MGKVNDVNQHRYDRYCTLLVALVNRTKRLLLLSLADFINQLDEYCPPISRSLHRILKGNRMIN